MNDFESRLTEALSSGAEQAPDADGLAAGARRRSRTRRRTRVAVGIGVVVAALVVPVGVLALGGDDAPDRVATDPADEPKGWHTVEHEGVLVDIPGGWHELDTSKCEFGFVRFGPDGADACTFDHEGLGFYASATFDPKHGPGVIDERKRAAGPATSTPATGRSTPRSATRIEPAASSPPRGWRARRRRISVPAGAPSPTRDSPSTSPPRGSAGGLSAWCLDETVDGWVEDPETIVPMIACEPSTGYGVRFGSGDRDDWIRERHGSQYPEGSWAGVAITPDASREAGRGRPGRRPHPGARRPDRRQPAHRVTHKRDAARRGVPDNRRLWDTWTSPECASSCPTAGCCSTTCRSGWVRAPRSRWSAPTAPARRRCSGSSPASSCRTPVRSPAPAASG